MDYKEIVFHAAPEYREQVIAALIVFGFDNFSEDDSGLHAFLPSEQWTDDLEKNVREALHEMHQDGVLPEISISISDVPNQNWQKSWEESVDTVSIGKRILIRPSWRTEPVPPGTIEIIIDPKMSFGTGHHETTRLTIELLEHRLKAGMSVLDVGTGTGILAIVAAKLGASRVCGIDIDPDAYQSSIENAVQNNVQDIVSLYLGKINEIPELHRQSFNIVVANIDRSNILNMLDLLQRKLKAGGMLILSGILESDLGEVKAELQENRFMLVETANARSETGDLWIALTATI